MNTNLITKGSLYLLLIVPFIVSSSMFFPYITGKNIVFRILIAIAALGWAYVAWRNKEKITLTPLEIAFGAFTLVMLLSALFGVNPAKSLFSNLERMEGWITIASLFLLLLVFRASFKEDADWNRYLGASLAVSAFISIKALLDVNAVDRISDTFGNPTYLGVFTLFHVWIGFLFISRKARELGGWNGLKSSNVFWGASIAILLNLIAMYFTQTRSVWLGLIVGSLVALSILSIRIKEKSTVRTVSRTALVALLLLFGLFFSFRSSELVQNSALLSRFANISLDDATTRSRTILWQVGFETFKDRPVLGWGQDTFIYAFGENYDTRMYDQEEWFDRAHNVFFDWLTQGGILGLLTYLSLFALALYSLYKSSTLFTRDKALLIGLLVAYFVNNFFVFDNITSYILFVLMLGYIAFHSNLKKRELSEVQTKAVIVLISLISLIALYSSVQAYRGATGIISGLQSLRSGNINTAEESFVNASRIQGASEQEAVEQFMLATRSEEFNRYPVERKQSFASKSIEAYEDLIEKDPRNGRLRLLGGGVYRSLGLNEDALREYEAGVKIMPKKQSILIGYAEALLAVGRNDEAIGVMRGVYEEGKQFPELEAVYAAMLIDAGRIEEGMTLLRSRENEEIYRYPAVIRSLSNAKQFPYLIEVLKAQVAAQPENPQARLSLAAIYYQMNDRKNSLLVLETIVKDFPELEGQVRSIMEGVAKGTIQF